MAKNRGFISKNDEKEPDYVKKSHNNDINAWCDASFDEKRKMAGIGIVVQRGQKERYYSVFIPAPNINYAELYGIYLTGVLMGGERGTIYSDSLTAVSYANNQVNNDRPRTKEQYENHQRMRLLGYQIRKLPITVEWQKGHCKDFQKNAVHNQMVDLLAKNARAKYYSLDKSKGR